MFHSVEKTEDEKKKDFITALKNQDLTQIKSYINQENFDVNKPLESEAPAYNLKTPLEIVLMSGVRVGGVITGAVGKQEIKVVKPEVLRTLIEKGAKPELSQPGQDVNLAHAICQSETCINKCEVIKTLSESEEFVEQLKKRNPHDQSTVLHSLAKIYRSQQEVIEFLVKNHGFNVDEPDHEGNTPLHVARHVGSALALINSGANYQCKNNNQSTPIDMEIENHDLMNSDEKKICKSITGGFFPISIAVIESELRKDPNKSYEEIENIFIENTKESNHSFFLATHQQNVLSESSLQQGKASSTSYESRRMHLDQLFERQRYQMQSSLLQKRMIETTVPNITTSVDQQVTSQSEKTVKKSIFSRFFSRRSKSSTSSGTPTVSENIESKEKIDRYADCAWLNPVAGPSEQRKQEEQQEQAAKEKKIERQARPSYS